MNITFLGAAGEVTGSSYLIETEEVRFLVDCGMFQGGPEAHLKNIANFGFDPAGLDFVLITHAHIDHSGMLPRLAAEGYRGPIYATAPTCDLLEVLLTDSAHIQEKEAEWSRDSRARRRNHNHDNGEPLYSVAQAIMTLQQLKRLDYGQELRPHRGVRCIFRDAGHILGSAIIEVWLDDVGATRKLVFSGDIGQPMRPIVRDPTPIDHADVLLVESTYGDRLHRPMEETRNELEHAIVDTLKRKHGNVIIPAFAVGRTQDLLYLLVEMHHAGRLPDMDIYVDSPMAMKATAITMRHPRVLDEEARQMMAWLQSNNGKPRINFVQDLEESISLHEVKEGAIIISASGMCEAGRIKHHLRHNLSRPECTVLITGFQAAGTLGRRLVDGAHEVKIFGVPVPVRADIYTINGLSAHADQSGLMGWLRKFTKPPRHTYVVHGEPGAADVFAKTIKNELHWTHVEVPSRRMMVEM